MRHFNFLSRRVRQITLPFITGLFSLISSTTSAQTLTATPKGATALSTQISNKIKFGGQVPDNQTNYRADPIDLCPNIVDGATGNVASQPYQFQFESNCKGNNDQTVCRYRPNFIWVVKYFTEAGNSYEERWQDQTSGDFSKIRLYMYDRIPYYSPSNPYAFHPTNQQATAAGGNSNVSPWVTNCSTPPNNTAQPNELIVRAQLECTGYSCGLFEGDDTDILQIRYFRRRPGPITVANAPTQLCRNVSYTLTTSAVFDATFYTWSAGNGATISGNGTTATLNLTNVPSTATSINVNVVAQNAGGSCGVYASAARPITFAIAQGPAQPQGLGLTNGRCPTSTGETKTAYITPGPTGTYYYWTVNGPGAAFVGASQGTDLTSVSLTTPQNGQVTVTVKAQASACGGYGAALTQDFQIGNIAMVPPSGIKRISRYDNSTPTVWCMDAANYLQVVNYQPGLKYYMSISDVVPAEGPGPDGITKIYSSGGPSGDMYFGSSAVTSFRVNITTINPCPAPGASTFDTRYFVVNIPAGQPIYCDNFRQQVPNTSFLKGVGSSTSLLYPNPSDGKVTIVSQASVRYQWVKVLDAQGRLVSEQHVDDAAGVTSLDLKKLPAGLYQVQLFDGNQLRTERLAKE